MSEEILIEIDETGNHVRVEGQGIMGPDCKKLTAAIEAALGVVTHSELKAEYQRARPIPRPMAR